MILSMHGTTAALATKYVSDFLKEADDELVNKVEEYVENKGFWDAYLYVKSLDVVAEYPYQKGMWALRIDRDSNESKNEIVMVIDDNAEKVRLGDKIVLGGMHPVWHDGYETYTSSRNIVIINRKDYPDREHEFLKIIRNMEENQKILKNMEESE